MIVGVATMPDVTRYARSRAGSVTAAVVGNGAGLCISMIMMLIPPIALHVQDPTRYLMLLGKPLLAVAVLLLATWPVNALNLYSAGLVASAVLPRVGYGRLVLLLGAAGTVAAMAGVGVHLMAFLDILGFMAAPIAGVYIADFFVLRRRAAAAPSHRAGDLTNLSALTATASGCALGALSNFRPLPFTVSSAVDSFVAAALLYLALERVRSALGVDRLWRRAGNPAHSSHGAS
jgi:cytosine permease